MAVQATQYKNVRIYLNGVYFYYVYYRSSSAETSTVDHYNAQL
jgi:hypothetical protein